MNTKFTIVGKFAAVLFGSALFMGTAKAQIVSHSRNLVIEEPTHLPELAQRPGIAFHLYTGSGDGSAYLYIEQHNGQRLAVFDVTDPAHVRMVRAVQLSVPGPYDFGQSLDDSAILVRFRNNMGVAVLDLRKAKMPVLRTVSDQQYFGRMQQLDESTYLTTQDRLLSTEPAPRDYRVIDTSNPANPVALYDAKLVNGIVTRDETGTTFLLSSDGLTIIRHPQVEDEYQAEQRATN